MMASNNGQEWLSMVTNIHDESGVVLVLVKW